MNFKKIIAIAFFAALLGGLLLTSCSRSTITDAELEAADDNTNASGISQDAQNISDQGFAAGNNLSFRLAADAGSLFSACATVTRDSINKVNTIDFGTSPCLCKDGRYRQGQLIAHYSGPYFAAGTVINITFANYFVGKTATAMHQVAGTKDITNNGLDANGNMNWTINAALTITKPSNGGTVTFNETRNRTWIAGASTPFIFADDKYQVTGNATGTTASGAAFTSNVVAGHELIRDFSCPKHFTQGQIQTTVGTKPTMTIDFGNGTCDNTATVTRNGKTKTITLK